MIRGWQDEETLVLEVTNPVAPGQPARPPRRGNRMALDNIRERLELAFQGRASVEVHATDELYAVRLRFPRIAEDGGAETVGAEATDGLVARVS